jgi:molybdopterin molybdotransferase
MIAEGEGLRILTGAVVPPNVEAIAMQEDCQLDSDRLIVGRLVRNGDNIRRQGEEYRAGDTQLRPGTLVTPIVAGLATAQGYATLRLGGAPRVAILATGNELRAPGEELEPGAVYASNVTTFVSALRALGLSAQARVISDDAVLIRSALEEAFETADLVITTGGVSVGDRDYVRDCARRVGVDEVFWRVAMKPGKPVFFGLRQGKPMLGLPGNAVAAIVAFHLFVRPALLRLMGAAEPDLATFPVRLGASIRKRAGRMEFVRVRLDIEERGFAARPVAEQGSHMLGGLASADALLHLAEERASFEEGEFVPASFLRWSLL